MIWPVQAQIFIMNPKMHSSICILILKEEDEHKNGQEEDEHKVAPPIDADRAVPHTCAASERASPLDFTLVDGKDNCAGRR